LLYWFGVGWVDFLHSFAFFTALLSAFFAVMSHTVMMTGAAKVRLDDKGRLALPNRYRDALAAGDSGDSVAAGLVLTMHPHKHLALYTERAFAALRDQVLSLPNLAYEAAHLQELIVGCAESAALDSAGRISVSGALRARAGIGRDALLFGVGEKIHIWDEQAWEQRDLLLRARLQDAELSEQWRALKI